MSLPLTDPVLAVINTITINKLSSATQPSGYRQGRYYYYFMARLLLYFSEWCLYRSLTKSGHERAQGIKPRGCDSDLFQLSPSPTACLPRGPVLALGVSLHESHEPPRTGQRALLTGVTVGGGRNKLVYTEMHKSTRLSRQNISTSTHRQWISQM